MSMVDSQKKSKASLPIMPLTINSRPSTALLDSQKKSKARVF
jgi:hypothetical protein